MGQKDDSGKMSGLPKFRAPSRTPVLEPRLQRQAA